MFERFTDRARRVVVLAQEEARLLDHNYIGTEHILLGLIQEGEGVAAQALEALEISVADARARVVAIIGHGSVEPCGHIPFTPRAKKVLELSLREALQLGHNYIGTEHILLGLLREGEGVAAQVLTSLGADLPAVRAQVIQLLSGPGRDVLTLRVSAPTVPTEPAPHCSLCGRDLWEVDHYAGGAGAFICEVCIAAAHAALEGASLDVQLLTLPPRVFGAAHAKDPEALAKVELALNMVFGSLLSGEAADYIEDSEQLLPILLGAADRFADIRVSEVVVERVRFDRTGSGAVVAFALGLTNGTRFLLEGRVVAGTNNWVVTRRTIADVLRLGGIEIPLKD